VCGASNISFGMPNRGLLNATFVAMAIAAGMTCAITNPIESEIRNAIYAADVLMGHDESAMRYLSAMRQLERGDEHGVEDRRAQREARRSARRAERG
jgi:5-methyltetrahydrofolate--homocysteine methyltransferase